MTITLLGEVRRVGDTGTVHVEDVYNTDIEDLWGAVTDPERLARWIARVDGDLRVRPRGRDGSRYATRRTACW